MKNAKEQKESGGGGHQEPTEMEIREAKRQRRKAEKKCRTSKLDVDLVVFKRKRNAATKLMNRARQEFYTKFINENSENQGKLFKASKRLFNPSSDSGIPSNIDSAVFANGIGSFFAQKIVNIRRRLDGGQGDEISSSQCDVSSRDLTDIVHRSQDLLNYLTPMLSL